MFSKNFEVVNVVKKDESLNVEVEFEDRSRKKFVFPFESRIFEEEDGVPFFVRRIQRIIFDKLNKSNDVEKLDLSKYKKRFEAKGFERKKRGENVRPCKLGPNALKDLNECPEALADYLDDVDFRERGFKEEDIKRVRDKSKVFKRDLVK